MLIYLLFVVESLHLLVFLFNTRDIGCVMGTVYGNVVSFLRCISADVCGISPGIVHVDQP